MSHVPDIPWSRLGPIAQGFLVEPDPPAVLAAVGVTIGTLGPGVNNIVEWRRGRRSDLVVADALQLDMLRRSGMTTQHNGRRR